jgi:hypothetical protein
MSNLFKTAFLHVLKEEPEMDSVEMTDKDAMAQSLDKGSSPEDFDVDADAAVHHAQATSKMHDQMVHTLQGWIGKLEEFKEFLNGTAPDTMQSKLKNAIPETLFDKIRVAESKKISRVAMEISSLNELMKGYLANSNNAKLKFQ